MVSFALVLLLGLEGTELVYALPSGVVGLRLGASEYIELLLPTRLLVIVLILVLESECFTKTHC